jgi:hypothetical protein
MSNFLSFLTHLQAAIAVVAARERALTVLLVAVWGRIGRMGTRLERLIALWRAGKLPKQRKSRAGEKRDRVRTPEILPRAPAWLVAAVHEAGPMGNYLEHLLTQEECVAFLAAVPQAGRILRPLCRMLGVGVAVRRARRPGSVWQVSRSIVPAPPPAGLVLGPGGRLIYV